MTIKDWIYEYLNDFYNVAINWMVKRCYLRATTIWAIMRRMDKQVAPREMEYYINEYKKWKARGFE